MLNSTHSLAAAAQHELESLRAELDARLAALEHALAHPEAGPPLERLVIDLARVATAEAEAAAARATLEAQLDAQQQAGVAVTEAQAAADVARAGAEALRAERDAERARGAGLKAELEQMKAALDRERELASGLKKQFEDLRRSAAQEGQAAATRARELEAARAELQSAAAAADAGHRQQIETLDLALQRAREEVRQAAEGRAAIEAAQHAEIASLERRCADLDDARRAGLARASETDAARQAALKDVETLTARLGATGLELAAARQEHADALAAADARAAQLDGQRQDAEARAEAASTDRDGLRQMLDAAKTAVREMNAAVDERLAAIDAKRARALQAAEDRTAAAQADVEAARAERDAERARGIELRGSLEQTQAALEQERELAARMARESENVRREAEQDGQAGAARARELEAARVELQSALATGAKRRQRVEELELALEGALADARQAAAARAADQDAHRAAVEALEHQCAELDEARGAAISRGVGADIAYQTLAAEVQTLKSRLEQTTRELEAARLGQGQGVAAAEARAARLDAELRDAVALAEEAVADRDALRVTLDAAKKAVQGMNAAVDERLAAIDAKRARALEAAQERAEAAIRERDALAAELAAVTAAATDNTDTARQLEAAAERIHTLELQLFERDRGPRELDVDLDTLLPATTPSPIDRSGKPATRYAFKPPRRARVDRDGALLVDLSVTGAQVICASPPEVGRIVTLALLSEEAPCFCQGRLLWSRREQTAKGRPYRYPAGIAFTDVDDRAILAFIAKHADAQ